MDKIKIRTLKLRRTKPNLDQKPRSSAETFTLHAKLCKTPKNSLCYSTSWLKNSKNDRRHHLDTTNLWNERNRLSTTRRIRSTTIWSFQDSWEILNPSQFSLIENIQKSTRHQKILLMKTIPIQPSMHPSFPDSSTLSFLFNTSPFPPNWLSKVFYRWLTRTQNQHGKKKSHDDNTVTCHDNRQSLLLWSSKRMLVIFGKVKSLFNRLLNQSPPTPTPDLITRILDDTDIRMIERAIKNINYTLLDIDNVIGRIDYTLRATGKRVQIRSKPQVIVYDENDPPIYLRKRDRIIQCFHSYCRTHSPRS